MRKEFSEKTYRKIVVGQDEYVGRDGYKNRLPDYLTAPFGKGFFSGKRVLDLGCASGAVLFMLAQSGIECGVGVEIDKKKLDIGREIKANHAFDKIQLYETDILSYFRDHLEQFDCVFLLNILHHLPNPHMVMDYSASVSSDIICMEMPDKAWYVPYPRDKAKKKSFNRPLGPAQIISYMKDLSFHVQSILESENRESFIGGTRNIYIFKKQKIPKCLLSDISRKEPQLIIGPGCAGKTTLLEGLGLKTKEESGGPYKFRDKGSYKQIGWRGIIEKVTGCSGRYALNVFNSQKPILYLNPDYQYKICNGTMRGIRLNTDAWLDIIEKQRCKALVCYAPKRVLKQRLADRLRSRFLKGIVSESEIDAMVNILTDHNLDDNAAEKEISRLSRDNFKQVKRAFSSYFYSSYAFSYERLFAKLEKRGMPYGVIDTYGAQGKDRCL
jgi:hypothetical protein